jgi:hypothetical protein
MELSKGIGLSRPASLRPLAVPQYRRDGAVETLASAAVLRPLLLPLAAVYGLPALHSDRDNSAKQRPA